MACRGPTLHRVGRFAEAVFKLGGQVSIDWVCGIRNVDQVDPRKQDGTAKASVALDRHHNVIR